MDKFIKIIHIVVYVLQEMYIMYVQKKGENLIILSQEAFIFHVTILSHNTKPILRQNTFTVQVLKGLGSGYDK